MNAILKNSIANVVADAVEWRRDFHRNPEILYDLPRTAGIVAAKLRDFGFDEVIEGIGRTGILGILHGASGPAKDKSRRVLFRADMDALPIAEASGVEHASTTAGLMHACGHDGHTAMLLGAARHLADTRTFDGTIVFCFQPAEEGGAGAQAMIDDGMLERFPVKDAYALHNWPGMPVGEFGVIRGPAMASSDAVPITVHGTGTHSAQPQLGRDPILVAAHMVTALQSITSRVVDPQEPAVVSITEIRGGDTWNVIPDKVEMKCNTRAFTEETALLLKEEIHRICRATAQAYGARVEIGDCPGIPYPPTINHHDETEHAVAAMRAVAGEDKVHDQLKPVMGSEDFAFVLRQVPGAYVMIGNGDSANLHNPAYDFNDAAIPYGISYWTELAKQVLPITNEVE